MILFLAALAGGPIDYSPERAPSAVVVSTSRGERAIAVSTVRGYPAVAAVALESLLPVSALRDGDWMVVEFAQQPFRFLLGAPLFDFRGRIEPLIGGAYIRRDSLFVPLQWLAEVIPRLFHEAYRYEPRLARFEELGRTAAPGPTLATIPPVIEDAPEAARRVGLRLAHRIVLDAGHGGRDHGTSGGGIREKDVALAIAKRLRDELMARGIEVVMTRTTDVFIDLTRRAPVCDDECDLFVSIHANALDPSPGYSRVAGFETFFLDHRRIGSPDRLEARENASLRYESEPVAADDPLSSILRDLEEYEYLRESAQLAELIHNAGSRALPSGGKRVGQLNLAVLRLATRPAVLVETGFLTNRGDAQFLRSRSGQQRIAEAVADGIIEYLRRYEAKVAPTPP